MSIISFPLRKGDRSRRERWKIPLRRRLVSQEGRPLNPGRQRVKLFWLKPGENSAPKTKNQNKQLENWCDLQPKKIKVGGKTFFTPINIKDWEEIRTELRRTSGWRGRPAARSSAEELLRAKITGNRKAPKAYHHSCQVGKEAAGTCIQRRWFSANKGGFSPPLKADDEPDGSAS